MHLERAGLAAFILFAIAACATMSPRSRLETQLIEIGIGERGAECLADDLSDSLSRRELSALANFLEGLNRSGRRSGFDSILRIDDPSVAAKIAGAGVTCALAR